MPLSQNDALYSKLAMMLESLDGGDPVPEISPSLASRCSNNVDMIVFTMHPNGYKKQCQDEPLGTYIAPVATFVGSYLDDMASQSADVGQNYDYPAVSQYISCSPFVIENVEYYFQLGCADGTTQALAVNIYKDNACTQRSTVDGGYDDSNIDVSEIQVRKRVV